MKLAVNKLEIDIRKGTVEDIPLLLSFIREMAAYEKLAVTATEAILRESLFGEHPAAYTLFVFINHQPVAYAVYFFSFSTMNGKRSLWLEDIYVKPEFRKKGIAKTLMAYLADFAVQNDCGRFEWIVLDWNKPAIDFYRKLGAKSLDDWRIFRLDQDDLFRTAKQIDTYKN